ncbi:hypothetical protein Mapa_006711 [Marchantia paleacea]|nr:hypothetical protein Mapa_006711 [Marchantia paleacea]
MFSHTRSSVLSEMLARFGCTKLLQLGRHIAHRRASTSSTKEALQYIAHGLSAVVEADRILPYTDPDDTRVQPLLKKAKENFELALEVENSNTDAMLLLSRLHMYYHIPGACPASGAALLEAAADAGNPVAQYELACRLRAEGKLIGIGDGDGMDEKAFKYLEMAACKKHPGALFLMGATYLGGKHTKRDVKAAAWCFRNAAEQGHTAAATVYGALMARGLQVPTEESQEDMADNHPDMATTNLHDMTQNGDVHCTADMEEAARYYFEIAAESGDGLALEWLNRMPAAKETSENTDQQ